MPDQTSRPSAPVLSWNWTFYPADREARVPVGTFRDPDYFASIPVQFSGGTYLTATGETITLESVEALVQRFSCPAVQLRLALRNALNDRLGPGHDRLRGAPGVLMTLRRLLQARLTGTPEVLPPW